MIRSGNCDRSLRFAVLRDPPTFPLFSALIRHYDELVDHIRRRFGDRHFARDVVQDVCVQLLERPPETDILQPLAFLRHISTHKAIDRCRAEKAFRDALDEWAETVQLHDTTVNDAEYMLAFQQRVDHLARCIDALPPRCRDVFVLHRIHDLPQHEVAAVLGISRGMVARHMARAMAMLLSNMEHGDANG